MSSWFQVESMKFLISKEIRTFSNFYLFFDRNYIYNQTFNPSEIKIQTTNIAMVNFFFDINDFIPVDNPDVWSYIPKKSEKLEKSENKIRKGTSFLDVVNSDSCNSCNSCNDDYLCNISELHEDDSLLNTSSHSKFSDISDIPKFTTMNSTSLWKEIKWNDLWLIMSKKPLQKRKISDFCGYFIYGENNNPPGYCNRPLCSFIHTLDLSKMKIYLDNPKVKSFDCMYSNNCKFFVCLFRHCSDNLLFYQSPVNSDVLSPITQCSDSSRLLAAFNHKLQSNK